MKTFSEKDLYYIAGLLEGEGSFTSTHSNTARYISIKIKMTDKDIIDWVADMWETTVYMQEYDNHWKTSYTTQLRRKAECIEFLKLIHPLMGTRRSQRIQEILEEFDNVESI